MLHAVKISSLQVRFWLINRLTKCKSKEVTLHAWIISSIKIKEIRYGDAIIQNDNKVGNTLMFIYVVFTKVLNIKLSYWFLISNANNHALILLGIQTVWFISTLEEYRGLFLLGFPRPSTLVRSSFMFCFVMITFMLEHIIRWFEGVAR